MSPSKFSPHYSHSVKAGQFVFTSGQLPLVSREPLEIPESIEDQTRLVLQKVSNLLQSYGLSKENIIKTTAYITNGDDWDKINAIYVEYFGKLKPARSIIPVASLHFDCKIELEAVAFSEFI